MPEASNEIVIARPPEEVFAFLADAANDKQWRSGVLDIEKVSGDGLGAVYKQGVKGPGGKRIDADIERTELDPPRRIGFRTLTGPVRPTGRYELAADGTGTRVRFSLDAELKGLKKAMSPMVQKTMRSEVEQLAELKRVLEAR
jgi:carbon monoxide dehydrogenase subunit G